MILIPAPGKKYHSKLEIQYAWTQGEDFIVKESGKAVNVETLKVAPGTTVVIHSDLIDRTVQVIP